VARHEDAGAALVSGTLAPQPADLSVLVHLEAKQSSNCCRRIPGRVQTRATRRPYLVVFEHSELDLLPLVLVLLRGGVGLLLPLLGAASQPQHQVQSRLLNTKRPRFINKYRP